MTKKNKNLIYAGLLIGGLAYLFRKKKGTDLTVEDVKKQGGESQSPTEGDFGYKPTRGDVQSPTEGGGATVETRGDVNTPLEVFESNTDTETFRLQ